MAAAAPKILLAWTYLVKFGNILISSGPKSAVRRSYSWLANAYADWSFDRRHNIDTFGEVALAGLTILDKNFDHDQDVRRYQQTPVVVFRAIMSTLSIDHNEYVFVDFGSGKGKVLLMASEYNFQKIVGVEFAEELHRIAQQNLAKYSDENQRCYDIELVLADATDFPIPDQKCVFFLFNPFKGAEHVLAKVIDNIYCSYCANPRTMYFVYFNPISKHLFDELDFVRLRAMQNYQSGDAAIYETSCDWMRRSDEQQEGHSAKENEVTNAG